MARLATPRMDGANSPWRMFVISTERSAGDTQPTTDAALFFLAPVLSTSLQGRPIEEVLFLRDEMANMAWAVERIVESRVRAADIEPYDRLMLHVRRRS